MASTKYFSFIYLDWDSKKSKLIYSVKTDTSKSLIKVILMESLSSPSVLDKFVPEQYYDINKTNSSYRDFKNYINNT